MNAPQVKLLLLACGGLAAAGDGISAGTVFETTSIYHHIRVIDQSGIRTLSFDGSMETRMSLRNPIEGHFEYVDYFHMPWLWNDRLTNVLMIGLGGGSIQRAYQYYHPKVHVDTVEIDPVVVQVAQEYFHVKEGPTVKIHVDDGRVFLRRSQRKYDAIFIDAYVRHRYGSAIPYHLATKEFFEMTRNALTTNGVVAYNVIGRLQIGQADLLGSIYKTLKAVFPQVYLFPAQQSQNIVLIATRAPQQTTSTDLQYRARTLIGTKQVMVPSLWGRLNSFRITPPANVDRCQVLSDDFAPVDGLLKVGN